MSVTAFVVCDAVTGEILRTGTAPESMVAAQVQAGETLMVGLTANDATQRVNVVTGAVIDKFALAATIDKTTVTANALDTCTITNIPSATHARILVREEPLASVDVNDGVLVLTFDTPGAYTLELSAFLWLPQTFEITAV